MKVLLDLDLNSFCSKNDNELAVIAKSNKSAVSALVLRYLKLVYFKSKLFANQHTDSDDLYQEGLMGLLSAIYAFNPGKNVQFSAFAEVCIVNRMKSLLSKGAKKTELLCSFDQIDELRDVPFMETPESIYLYKEYFYELFSGISAVLSPIEKNVFMRCVQGFSYKDTAIELGITEKSVDNAMQRARRKVRAMMQRNCN